MKSYRNEDHLYCYFKLAYIYFESEFFSPLLIYQFITKYGQYINTANIG